MLFGAVKALKSYLYRKTGIYTYANFTIEKNRRLYELSQNSDGF